jgi:hypothetical protein
MPVSLRGSRVERYENALVKDHGGVATGDADLAVWRLPVHNFRGGHIAGRERGTAVKPYTSPYAYKKSPCYEIVFDVAVAIIASPRTSGRATGWSWWLLKGSYKRRHCLL